MFQALISLHVLSSLLLGTFVVLPFLVRRITTIPDREQAGFIKSLQIFTRFGHYALIVLLLTGGGLIFESTNKPPFLWTTSALILLLIISAAVGVLAGNLKKLHTADEGLRSRPLRLIRFSSLVTAVSVLAAVLMMTNR